MGREHGERCMPDISHASSYVCAPYVCFFMFVPVHMFVGGYGMRAPCDITDHRFFGFLTGITFSCGVG